MDNIYLGWASQVVLVEKNPPAKAGDIRDARLIPGSGRSPREGNGYPLKIRSILAWRIILCSPWGHEESDMTERLSLSPVGQFLLSCLSRFASWELVLAFLLLKCENCQFFPVQEANYWVGFPRICLYRNVGTSHLQLMSLQLFPALWGKQWSLSLGSLWALGSGEDCIFGTLFGETPAKSYKSYWL